MTLGDFLNQNASGIAFWLIVAIIVWKGMS
jgi:hypothetical protein